MAVDWEGLWQERRGLILKVAGGLIVVLLGESLVHGLFARPLEKDRRAIVRAERKLHAASPGPDDVAAAEQAAGKAEQAVDALREAILFHVREPFTLPEGDPHPTVRYVDTVDRTLDALQSLARRQGVSIPDALGFPQVAPSDEARVSGLLSALDGIERAVRRAVESGIGEIESVRVVDETPRMAKDGPGIGVQEVKIIANGEASALFEWMRGLREDGIGFGPARIETVARRESLLRAELTLRFLIESDVSGGEGGGEEGEGRA